MAGIAVAFQEVERHCIEDSRVSCINNAFQYMKVYFPETFPSAGRRPVWGWKVEPMNIFMVFFIRQGGAGIGGSIWEVVCLISLILYDAVQKFWIVRGEVGGT